MLQIGSRGSAVVALQKKLGVTADGVFGPQTAAALRAWQAKNGLTADGIFGSKSQAKMGLGGSSGSGSGGGGAAKGGASAKDAADAAANLGYSMAFFNSDKELKNLLNTAVSEGWTPNQFTAKLQATKWFKKNGEAARQIYALKTSDPATYNQRLNSARSQVQSIAYQLGSGLSAAQLTTLSEHALAFGWTDQQIKQSLVSYVKADKNGVYAGTAGQAQSQLRELAASYGVNLSASQLGTYVQGMVKGQTSIEQVQTALINQTASKYPGLKDRLLAGETLNDIAAPYKDSYSRVLEVNPQTINLNDPMLQKALSTKDAKGMPTTQTVWQFENDLRADPRWLKTNNARESLVGTTRKLLQDFGLAV